MWPTPDSLRVGRWQETPSESHKVSMCSGVVARPQRVPGGEQEGDPCGHRPGGLRQVKHKWQG